MIYELIRMTQKMVDIHFGRIENTPLNQLLNGVFVSVGTLRDLLFCFLFCFLKVGRNLR